MFAKDTLKIYDYLYTVTTFIKCVPFGWNNQLSTVKLYPLTKHNGRSFAYLNASLFGVTSTFIFYGLTCYLFDRIADSSGIIKFVPSLALLFGIAFISTLQYFSYQFKQEVAILVNKIFQTGKLIGKYKILITNLQICQTFRSI
jgi:hypothetical protein